MTSLSLRQAAEQAGTSKSTIFRAIKAGRLSAARTDDGGFAIDPAELFRVYPPKTPSIPLERSPERRVGHDATVDEAVHVPRELEVKVAVMETELRSLKDMVTELRAARDQWQQQAERITLAIAGPERRSWWKRLAG